MKKEGVARRLKKWNDTSMIAFAVSSFSLLFIPFLPDEGSFAVMRYVIAGLFWLGLLCGAIVQGVIALQGRKTVGGVKVRMNRLTLILSAFSFLGLLFLIFQKSKNSYLVVGCLFGTLFFGQLAFTLKVSKMIHIIKSEGSKDEKN